MHNGHMSLPPKRLTAQAKRGASLARSIVKQGSQVFGNRIREARLPDDYDPSPEDDFVAAAYFSAETDSVYQLEQWLWSFERLAEHLRELGFGANPFGIIVRSPAVATRLMSETSLPVRFSRLSKGLDDFMTAPGLRAVFYVNQAAGNFQALRFPRPAHVHLSHGESEKISMISNQLKAYDYVFTAGPAARKRIVRTLIGLDDHQMIDVGRPPLDRPRSIPAAWTDFDRRAPRGTTVFYAPTWEGDSAAMAYGTLAHNGTTLVSSMLDAGYRVIFRPHPRTGYLRSDFRRALEDVSELIDDHPRGLLDRSAGVDWQFDVADLALAEMSSVAFDWLATRKPLVMVAPHSPEAEVLAGGLLERCEKVQPGQESAIVELLRSSEGRELAADPDALCRDYLGDTGPGRQIARFVDAAETVIDRRSSAIDEMSAGGE